MTDGENEQPPSADPILRAFVSVFNKLEQNEVSLTLWVKGAMVTGRLVSMQAYLGGNAVNFEAKTGQKESFTRVFRDLALEHAEELAIEKASQADSEESSGTFPHFIHLKNAKVCAPGSAPIPSEGFWWRGRLDSVDAWAFGQLDSDSFPG